MKAIVLLIGLLMVALGLTGVVWPEGVMQLATYSFTATGLYVAAAVRILLGGLLFFAAAATRTPRTIRVIGLIMLIAGIATALIPAERAQSMKDWWLAHGPHVVRIAACFPLAVGIFLGWTTISRRP
ncbi:MAG TPA: hypothetical protein VF751_06585 [Chthoniobacterales bacterium]